MSPVNAGVFLLTRLTMPHNTMPTIEQLGVMDDLSAANLYRAEVQQIPFLTLEEQTEYVTAARAGDETARHALVLNCLNWTWRRAGATYRDYAPAHTDEMDLAAMANMKMLEALPNALAADNTVSYLMSVSANEMRRYCAYRDPLIERKRDQPLDAPHPGTVSLEMVADQADSEIRSTDEPEYRIVYDALAKLAPRHRTVLTAAYGLDGQTRHKNEDIAAMLNLPKQTVEKYLWRAKRRLAVKLAPYLGELGLSDA